MRVRKIAGLPVELEELALVVSVSGGKDSTATVLALREAGLDFRMVFADTGWESEVTYEHLEKLRAKLGPIVTVRSDLATDAEGAMLAWARKKAGFPMRSGRWCTEKLKIDPIRAYHDSLGTETVNVVGIRSSESESRSKMACVEDDPEWGGWIWRPLIRWTVADVMAIHHRHGIEVNPLYRRGHDRVGCYPCIFANKEEIRLVAEHEPARIDQIRELERAQSYERVRRNGTGEGNFKHLKSTFFSAREALGPKTIDEVVAWSKTARGGKQLPMLQPAPSGGCFRWGLCESPTKEEP